MSIDAGDDRDLEAHDRGECLLSDEAHAELEQLVDSATAGWLDDRSTCAVSEPPELPLGQGWVRSGADDAGVL